ncbi:LysR family transcriptional regulator [Dictyobacter formicarum]|uniref:LysR family transcriptional regulator n=1 Tax=Dictyobacter formicarum TaxID=2778368 RepID=A0ABQ3VF80_9CHLR|nr:LysR family transcriptional regulator [Dictyobacter formicarum]GHO84830.1 LysR family transcriptional regulator [Dictyobacter formicarum]
MNLQNLRVFLKVAELEHITRASEELHLTQPAVTKIIQSLEQEAHLELVERQGRRIVLTHAGRVLQTYARRMFSLEREMDDALAALRDIHRGEIKLAANTTAGVYLLPAIVARFRALYPQIALNISILNSQEIIEHILDWSLDFGIVEGEVEQLPESLNVRFFTRDTLILVVSPQHPWCNVDKVSATDLGNNALVVRESGSGVRDMLERELNCRDITLNPLLTLTDNEAIKQMVMNGVGAAVVSFLTVQRELASGDLVQVPLSDMELQPELSFIQRPEKQLSRAAQAFFSFLFPLSTSPS